MSEPTKYTPGPWSVTPARFHPQEFDIVSDPDPESPMFQALFTTYLQGLVPGTWFSGEANAHLAAAAPELYEALEAMWGSWESGGFIPEEHRQKARAALAKARGENGAA